jgi:hypothetical protein
MRIKHMQEGSERTRRKVNYLTGPPVVATFPQIARVSIRSTKPRFPPERGFSLEPARPFPFCPIASCASAPRVGAGRGGPGYQPLRGLPFIGQAPRQGKRRALA